MKLKSIIKENSSVILLSTVSFLSGIIAGILLAPIKKGFTIGCNNVATNYKNCNMKNDDEDLY